MFQHASTRRARLGLEQLGDRLTPSALLGGPAAHAPAPPGGPAAAFVAAAPQHAVPITLSARITSDGSGVLSLTGSGSHLGRWTGQGSIDSVDVAADRVVVSATATITTANGDQLFVSVSVSLSLAAGPAQETVTITGGTGRFAGAAGSVSAVCDTTFDPATLAFECNSQGSGILALDHSR
jgi:hypothetical protein